MAQPSSVGGAFPFAVYPFSVSLCEPRVVCFPVYRRLCCQKLSSPHLFEDTAVRCYTELDPESDSCLPSQVFFISSSLLFASLRFASLPFPSLPLFASVKSPKESWKRSRVLGKKGQRDRGGLGPPSEYLGKASKEQAKAIPEMVAMAHSQAKFTREIEKLRRELAETKERY